MELQDLLDEELSVFKQFSSFIESGDLTACYSQDTNTYPHWNLVYPKTIDRELPVDSLIAAQKIYSEKQLTGHLIQNANKPSKLSCVEEVEYFVANPVTNGATSSTPNFASHLADLTDFCNIVAKAFDFDQETRDFFSLKMEKLSRLPHSKFLIIEENGRSVGTGSTFRTQKNNDFLFNVAVLPEFANQGKATQMITHLTSQREHSLMTYSPTRAMREKILPKSGFKSIGTCRLFRLDEIISIKNGDQK